MLNGLATLHDAKKLSQYFAQALPEHARELSKEHAHPEGREVYTKAVWQCFSSLRTQLGEGWRLYPASIGKGAGKASGEYLVDFMLMDETFGPRIACESELGSARNIDWALDKLRGVKSDIKSSCLRRTLLKKVAFLQGSRSWLGNTSPASAITFPQNTSSSSNSARTRASVSYGVHHLAGRSKKQKLYSI